MGRKKNEEKTSWGSDPGKPIKSGGVTRRDLGKAAVRATIGAVAVTSGTRNPNQPDVTLHTDK
jgi:hypothetical protein